jgi:hypothetical protein
MIDNGSESRSPKLKQIPLSKGAWDAVNLKISELEARIAALEAKEK